MAAKRMLDLSIAGMGCGSCARHVTETLRGVDGVSEARVSLADGRARVEFDPRVATEERVVAAVVEAGNRAEAE